MKNPLSIDAFIDWLRTQPPSKRYNYFGPSCLMRQYHKHTGLREANPGQTYQSVFPWGDEISEPPPWTFGAALERAERLLEQPDVPVRGS